MNLKNYFIMPSNRGYSLREDYILALILMNSDSKVSYISRSKICELANCKDLKSISNITNKFQKDGYITKVYKYTKDKKLVEYHINKPKYYIPVMNSIMQFKELGIFAIKLAEYRINGTPCIYYSDNELIKQLHIGRTKYFSFKKELIKNNILIEDIDCYILNTDYFPVYKTISDKAQKDINTLLSMDVNFRGRKVFLYYYKQDFKNLNCSIEYFVDWCIANCPGINSGEANIPVVNYYF